MIRILFGIFLVLHGLVHLLYMGQSARLFELQPGMLWPDGSWALSKLIGEAGTRNLAAVLLILVAVGFASGGGGLLAKQEWWRPVIVSAAAFSTVVYLFLWDGKLQNLDDKGAIGILINLAIGVVALIFQF